MELCGGTHARRTGDIGVFKIIAEYGIASGVRRIEMVTGAYALDWINQQLALLDEMAAKLKTSAGTAAEKLTQFLNDFKLQEKELSRMQTKLAAKSGGDLQKEMQTIADTAVLIKQLNGADSQSMRTTLDQLKSSNERAIIVLYTVDNAKINVIAGITKSLVGQAPSAAVLVKMLCGKGGGREDMAQGGGPAPDDLDSRLAEITVLLEDWGKSRLTDPNT